MQIVVIRYVLKCTNCGARTLFRIRVGFSDRDPFEFECGRCSGPIRGELHLDQKNVKVLGLKNLEGAAEERGRSEEPTDFAQMHDNYFLVDSTATGPESFSAFLKAFGRHGKDAIVRSRNAAALERIIKDRPGLTRVIRNYQRGQWEHFAVGLAEYLPDSATDSEPARLTALLTLLDLVHMPYLASSRHEEFINAAFQCADECGYLFRTAMPMMLTDLRAGGYLAASDRDATNLALRVLATAEELRPLIVDWDPEHPAARVDTRLRVAAIARFDSVKALYVDAYELLCRDLTVGTALANLRDRSNPNSYPTHPFKKFQRFRPRSIREFHQAAHAPKISFLVEYPLYIPWAQSLDSSLRNAIGHNRITADSRTGLITYPARGRTVELTYANFLAMVLSCLVFVHEFHWLVAFLLVHFPDESNQ